jgi:hypothetical protein
MAVVRVVRASYKIYLDLFWWEKYGIAFSAIALFSFVIGFLVGGWWGIETANKSIENPGYAAGRILHAHPKSDYVRIRLYKNGKWYRGHGAGHNDHAEPIEDSWAPIGWKPPDEVSNK